MFAMDLQTNNLKKKVRTRYCVGLFDVKPPFNRQRRHLE